MTQPLPQLLDELLRTAAGTVEGRETLMRYDHTVNFDVLDGQPFHVEIVGGEAAVETGQAKPRPLAEAHNIRAKEAALRDWLEGRARFSDLIHEHRLYPMAAHTTKRHIDNWLIKLVRLGHGRPSLKDEY
ncbi:MAG: hypothetical protein U0401_27725 [Anaerolineae bacterium]